MKNNLFKKDSILKIFENYLQDSNSSWTGIYTFLSTNEKIDDSSDLETFNKFKEKCDAKNHFFKNGFNPAYGNLNNAPFYHGMHPNFSGELKHRIYLNPQVKDRPLFADILIKECLNNNVDFYFKYTRDAKRNDGFLIYSTHEQLEEYLNILERIKTEHPEIVKNCSKPPMSTIEFDGWLGYGVEEKSSEKGSLTKRTSKNLLNSFNKTILNNINKLSLFDIYDENFGKLLYNSCVSSNMNHHFDSTIYRQQFLNGKHTEKLRQEFNNGSFNILKFIKENIITDEQIINDTPIIEIVSENEIMQVRPSAIANVIKLKIDNIYDKHGKSNIENQIQQNFINLMINDNLVFNLPKQISSKYPLTTEEIENFEEGSMKIFETYQKQYIQSKSNANDNIEKSILDAIKDNQNKNAQTTPSDSTNSDKFIKKNKGQELSR